jgi:hypothetical protein
VASDLLQAISLLEVITRGVGPDSELETSLQMTLRHLHEAHNRFDRIAMGRAGGAA